MKPESNRKITVEDLLKLKRAERPSAEFWSGFEAQMRAKQLSAIVERRPWWAGFASVVAPVRRHQASLGAAAVVALSFAAYRYVDVRPAPERAAAPVAAAVPAAQSAHTRASAPATAEVRSEIVSVGAADVTPESKPLVSAASPHMTQAPASVVAVQAPARSPFTDGMAATLADYREPVADAGRSGFGSDRDFEAAITTVRTPVSDPLARMDPAAERRARLLSPGLPAYNSSESRAFAADWMKQRASTNDRIYESMDNEPLDRSLVGFRF